MSSKPCNSFRDELKDLYEYKTVLRYVGVRYETRLILEDIKWHLC